jgi:pilus assembly protein Flp/PilA
MDRLTEFYVRAENALATMADAEDGATAVEYGLIIALIAAVIVAIVAVLGGKIASAFSTVSSKL